MAHSKQPELNRTRRIVVTDYAGARASENPNGYQQERELVSLPGPVPDEKFTFVRSPKVFSIDKLLEDTPSLQDEVRFRDCLVQSFKDNCKAVVEGTSLIGEELDFLEANGCITIDDRCEVKDEIGPMKRVRRLLFLMLLRDYRSLLTFVKSLGFHNQHVADVVITKFLAYMESGFHKVPTCVRCLLGKRVDPALLVDYIYPLDDIWDQLCHKISRQGNRQGDLKTLWNEFFEIVKINKVYENISLVTIQSLHACGFHSDIVKMLEADQRQTVNSFFCRCGEIKEQNNVEIADRQVECNQNVATNPAPPVSPDNSSVVRKMENESHVTSPHLHTAKEETVPASKVRKGEPEHHGAIFCRDSSDIKIESSLTDKDGSERFGKGCSNQTLERNEANSGSDHKMELLKSVLFDSEHDHDSGIVEDGIGLINLFPDGDETELKQRIDPIDKPVTQSNQHETNTCVNFLSVVHLDVKTCTENRDEGSCDLEDSNSQEENCSVIEIITGEPVKTDDKQGTEEHSKNDTT